MLYLLANLSCSFYYLISDQVPTINRPSRNVARRGRGPWSSRVEARQPGRKQSCNFDKLRFKVTEDATQIIVSFFPLNVSSVN